ncbi:MAG: YbaK/EbsC family protein [Deltaproteobacteria bacterium]|nr:YbaK/EbsC family protein [Deltaproteobacteria bacterium]
MPASTRTAAEAAAAIGCAVAQIAKSIVFRDCETGLPVIVIASGGSRVDTEQLGRLAGTRIGTADADFVHQRTGYAIGGVPPFGHKSVVTTFIDDDLFACDRVWAAAGGPFSVFETTAQQLLEQTGGTRAPIKA